MYAAHICHMSLPWQHQLPWLPEAVFCSVMGIGYKRTSSYLRSEIHFFEDRLKSTIMYYLIWENNYRQINDGLQYRGGTVVWASEAADKILNLFCSPDVMLTIIWQCSLLWLLTEEAQVFLRLLHHAADVLRVCGGRFHLLDLILWFAWWAATDKTK